MSTDSTFPLDVVQVSLLICMSSNRRLYAKHCEYGVRILDYTVFLVEFVLPGASP